MDPRTSAQDVMRCDLCETAIVQMHCDTCLVNLCEACVGEHISTGETKDHKVVKFQDRKSTPIYPGCTSHAKERCEMYCKQCGIPACSSCLASKQHLGHELSKVLQVVDEKKDMIRKEKNELNEKICPTYEDIASDVQNRMSQIEKKYGDLSTALSSSSLTSDKHGYSMKTSQKSTKGVSSFPVKQLLDEPQTVTTIDTGYGDLYNVACLSDEEIWTSEADSTMKLYSINQGSLLKSITTKSGNMPHDIAVTKSGDLVYTDDNDRTVNIVKNEKIEEVIRLQNWRSCGVCSTSSGDLLVIMVNDDNKQTKVDRYSGSTEKQTIQFDDKGKPLFSSGILYITENRNLDICVSDCEAKEVVVVNQAGKLRFRYTGHTPAPKNQPFLPLGITTDSQSHILTADHNNECVHIIDQDGQFLRYIDCGLNYPYGLCTDTNDNLFVAQLGNKQVKKIKYLQ